MDQNILESYMREVEMDKTAWYRFPAQIKEDSDIFIHALMRNENVFRHAPLSIKQNPEIVGLALDINGYNIEYCLPEFKKDKMYAVRAIISKPHAIKRVDRALLNDRELVLILAKTGGQAFATDKELIPTKYFDDFEIMDYAVKSCPLIYVYGSLRYRSDPVRAKDAIELAPSNIVKVPYDLLVDYPELCLTAIAKHSHFWNVVPQILKDNPAFVEDALEANPNVINELDDDFSTMLPQR